MLGGNKLFQGVTVQEVYPATAEKKTASEERWQWCRSRSLRKAPCAPTLWPFQNQSKWFFLTTSNPRLRTEAGSFWIGYREKIIRSRKVFTISCAHSDARSGSTKKGRFHRLPRKRSQPEKTATLVQTRMPLKRWNWLPLFRWMALHNLRRWRRDFSAMTLPRNRRLGVSHSQLPVTINLVHQHTTSDAHQKKRFHITYLHDLLSNFRIALGHWPPVYFNFAGSLFFKWLSLLLFRLHMRRYLSMNALHTDGEAWFSAPRNKSSMLSMSYFLINQKRFRGTGFIDLSRMFEDMPSSLKSAFDKLSWPNFVSADRFYGLHLRHYRTFPG